MSDMDPIAAARALLEPLTGCTSGPWSKISAGSNSYHIGSGGWTVDASDPDGGYFEEYHICKTTGYYDAAGADARLMAAAPDLRDMVATLADAVEAERAEAEVERMVRHAQNLHAERARVAAAYEAAAQAAYEGDSLELSLHGPNRIGDRILALTPADAQAELDKMLAEARLKGWRAGRDAAADHCWAKRDLLADAEKKQIAAGLTGRDYYGRRLEAELLSRSIRALPEPKENIHD